MQTEAQKRALKKYREKCDQITIRPPVGTKARWSEIAKSCGYESMTQFIMAAVEEKIERS